MAAKTAYDHGYESVSRVPDRGQPVYHTDAATPAWGPATLRLHLGWLSTQLTANPRDPFRWGRYDALCDLLARHGPVRGAATIPVIPLTPPASTIV